MVRDEAYEMGCAMVQFVKSRHRTSILVCDYSIGCIIGHPVYNSSAEIGSECKTGTNPRYDGLCSTDEVYVDPVFKNETENKD